MAKINAGGGDAVFSISKWLGLNENPDGDTALKMGEAAEMRNFRITQDGHLQKRPGYKTLIDLGAPCKGLWTGYVGAKRYTLCAAGGKIYALGDEKTEIGTVSDENTHFFGFSEKVYILDGEEYYCWDGETFSAVEGYRPLVSVSNVPTGGGTALEQANKLNGTRRAQFSPDGEAKTFQLPETNIKSIDYVKYLDGTETGTYTTDLAAGTITFDSAPERGVNSLEIGWTMESGRAGVTKMRFSELFNGANDSRVFLYGDGTNKAVYSGLVNGQPSAEYFPDLNEMAVGESNTPITAMIRQYSRLLAFKSNSAWAVSYSTMTLADGTVTAGFYLTPVNRVIGNAAPGQVRLITNYPRTLHEGGVYEWKTGSSMSSDERNAKRISGRIETTLSQFDLTNCLTFDNEHKQDYYIVCGDKALVHNYAVDAWFLYDNFPAAAFTVVDGELYIGTTDGRFCHVSREYMSDDGENINAFWRSGSMDFGQEWRRKYSTMMFVVMKPEAAGRVTVTAWSDRKADYTQRVISYSLSTFAKVNFARFSFNTNRRSQVERAKIKVKNFALYQLVFTSDSANERSTIESVDFRLRYAGYVK